MARPRKNAEEKSAYERLSDAFWSAIEEKPFGKITVADISRRAGVNHNTFYYYFDNTEDMALKLMTEIVSKNEMEELLLPAVLHPTDYTRAASDLPYIEERFRGICSLIRRGSPAIEKILRNLGIDHWLHAMNVDPGSISETDRSTLVFIFGGLITLIKEYDDLEYSDVVAFINEDIGQMGRALLRGIMERNAAESGAL